MKLAHKELSGIARGSFLVGNAQPRAYLSAGRDPRLRRVIAATRALWLARPD
jgi:hypothetical protein